MNRPDPLSPAGVCGQRSRLRLGMTLIEMLVAMAATLMLMAAVAQAFSIFGKGISGSRSALDTAGRMRSAAWRLRQDLAGATAPTLPPLDPAGGLGYFEVIEGPRTDLRDETGVLLSATDLTADVDDVLLFTTRSLGEPFRGKFESGTIESDVAEVAWFVRETVPVTIPRTYTLYRKQMLVLGYVGTGAFETPGPNQVNAAPFYDDPSNRNPFARFYDLYDVSVSRRNAALDILIPNALGDLTRRECRFLHNVAGDTTGIGFPYWFIDQFPPTASPFVMPHQRPVPPQGLIFGNLNASTSSARRGEDIVLTNVIGFDVRMFDPSAPIQASASGADVVTPGDRTPPDSSLPQPIAFGAFVDLGTVVPFSALGSAVPPLLAGSNHPLSGLSQNGEVSRVYDTWDLGYEADGIDQDGLLGPDQGMDGLDTAIPPDPPDGVIDDPGERETSAPYPYPLRGIEVRIRCYEPTSRQVRQVTVRHTFVPH